MADVEILIECPPVPRDVEDEYRKFVRREGLSSDDEERWDQALDFVMFGLDETRIPWDDTEADVTCLREWAFELLRRIGEPYPGLESLSPDVAWVDGPVGPQDDDEEEYEEEEEDAADAALEDVQRHREALGLSPLDPSAAGWSEGDVRAEAERIRRLPNLGLV